MSEEKPKKTPISFSNLYREEVRQKIAARKNILREYHPKSDRAKKAKEELLELIGINYRLSDKVKLPKIELPKEFLED